MPSRASAAPAFVFVPDLGAAGSEVALSASESHYVARVCRVRVGEVLEGTDGKGALARLVVRAGDRPVRVGVESVERRERTRRAWLFCGEPEGQRDDWMVEKLAEFGVERWVPIDSERCRWDGIARRRDRWERLAIAALKQSRSAHLMQIAEPAALQAVHGLVPEGARRWLASPSGEALRPPEGPGLLAAVVGPAGGLTGAEEKWLTSVGFKPVSLAPTRLRAETAAVSLGAIWAAAG
jgi:16S rRNA (uracil1498-N3)-methyltransferase